MAFSFETLDVWKRSLDFADAMFELADGLPKSYQFSLGEQLRRAALPTPYSNPKLKLTKGVVTPDSNGIFREISQEQRRWLRQLVKQGGPSRSVYSHPAPTRSAVIAAT
jgi:hypothetical protein